MSFVIIKEISNYNVKMTLLENGNVGIGTSSPIRTLDVRGSIASVITDPEIGGQIELSNPAKTASGAASTWKIFNMTGGYGNSLQFWAYDNQACEGGLCNSRFTLMDNGNVGIDTNAPNAKLAVNGNIRAKEIKIELTNWPDYVFTKEYL